MIKRIILMSLVAIFLVACIQVKFYTPSVHATNRSNFNSLEKNTVYIFCEYRVDEEIREFWSQFDLEIPEWSTISGSGVVIYHGKEQQWVMLTAAHVVSSCERNLRIRAMIEGTDDTYVLPAVVGAINSKRDLAVLRTKDAFSYPRSYIKLAKDDPHLGDIIYTSGYPGAASPYYILTKGIVAQPYAYERSTRYFLIDGRMTYGNSGGPVVNEQIEVLGIASLIIIGRNGYTLGAAVTNSEIWKFLKKSESELYKSLQSR